MGFSYVNKLLDVVICAIAFCREMELLRIDGDKVEQIDSASMIIQDKDENIMVCLGCCFLYKNGNNCILYIGYFSFYTRMLLSFYKIIFDNAYGFVHINVILTNLMKVSILKSQLIYIRNTYFLRGASVSDGKA